MSDQTEKIEITQEHFEIFKAECEKWIEIFGLKGWKIGIIQTKDEPDNSRAWMNGQYSQRIATVCLPSHWNSSHEINSPTLYQLRIDAFHEVCEILLTPMDILAGARNFDKEEFDAARHAVIRTLENVVWKPLCEEDAK